MYLTKFELDCLETNYTFLNKSLKEMKKIRVCLYLRKSQEDEKDNSLKLQYNEIVNYLDKLNTNFKDKFNFYFTEEDVFKEDNRSGISTIHREEFNRMINIIKIKPGYYGMCLVFKLDRFSRDTEDTSHYKRILRENYCMLKALNFEDQGTPESILYLNMMAAVSQFHAQNSAKLSIEGTKQKVLQNKCVGLLPFGLTTEKAINESHHIGASNIVIDEEKALIILEIFTKYAEGMSLTDLTNYLFKKGYKNNNGNFFSRHQIYGILRNKKYNGTYIYADKTKVRKRKYNNGVIKPQHYEKENAIPKIISDELFNKVQVIIKSFEKSKRIANDFTPYFLTGKLICKCCSKYLVGDASIGGNKKNRYRYYTCPTYKNDSKKCNVKKINASYIEKVIINLVYKICNNLLNNYSEEIQKIIKEKINEFDKMITKYNKQISLKENMISKLIKKSVDVSVNDKFFEKEIDKLVKEIEDLKENIKILEYNQSKRISKYDGLIKRPSITMELLLQNTIIVKALIFNIIDKIICDNEEIIVYFNCK